MLDTFAEKPPIDIKILFQDEYLIVVDKPSGLLVHRGDHRHGRDRWTLMNIVRDQIQHYVYPVHRLDRPVSGCLLFALTPEVAKSIKDKWHDESTIKEYLALARGKFDEPGEFNFPLKDEQGNLKEALTLYWPMQYFKHTTLYKIQIKTGRKHQIRRHFSRRCAGIIGDSTHGKGEINRFFRQTYQLNRIFLHSSFIQFQHPITNSLLAIESPLPEDLRNILEHLE